MIALIILNYNNASDTRNCIESIVRHNTAPVKFIVVDNASRPEQLEALRGVVNDIFPGYLFIDVGDKAPATLPAATLVETGENLGYGRGNNAGLELAYADTDISRVMILNNDILFVEDIIPPLIAQMCELPDCAIISPVLYKKNLEGYDYTCARRNIPVSGIVSDNFLHYYNKLFHRKSCASRQYILPENTVTTGCIPIELPSGSCMLVDKEYFREIGSFDPGTFLYYEENILYKKISATGRRNYLDLDTKCIHLGAATTEKLPGNLWLMKVGKRSETYYVKKFSGASGAMRALHRLSVNAFLLQYRLQKALGIKLRN